MNDCLISVIIPIYNTEKFLKNCLDSVRAQTFPNYEAILVDDGSTDNSGKICEEYACLDPRFRVVCQRNAGVSVARNRALEEAKGTYIFFLDSDDFLPEDAFEKLIQQDADLVIGSIVEVDESGNLNGAFKRLPNQELSRLQTLEALFDESKWGYQGYIGNKLYRCSIIKEQNIMFEPGIKYNEDRLFLTQYLLSCSKVIMLSSAVYFYRQQQNSALAKIRKNFEPSALTELDAFEAMKKLVIDEYPELYQLISQLAFEKSLYWLKQIPKKYFNEKKKMRNYVCKNAKICFITPKKGLIYKIKVILHCLFEQ